MVSKKYKLQGLEVGLIRSQRPEKIHEFKEGSAMKFGVTNISGTFSVYNPNSFSFSLIDTKRHSATEKKKRRDLKIF